MRIYQSLLLIALLFFTLGIKAQVTDSLLTNYATNYPQQKIHVHFDKHIYRAGEDIGFKAYVFAGFLPATNSINFYAELLDKNGKLIQRKVYPIVESSASGHFEIADTTKPGEVIFRGYTQWMLNFDTTFLFHKKLSIIGKTGETITQKARPAIISSIHFFPESGDLVEGLESVVAFKANDQFGLPVAVTGRIVNSEGIEVTKFNSQHNGMGTFVLTPKAGETYTALWHDENKIEKSTALPVAKPIGVVLSASNVADKIVFIVKRSPEAHDNLKRLYLLGTFAQEKVYSATIPLNDFDFTSGAIPVGKLPTGILQLTVFNAEWQPVAERIVFINNHNHSFEVNVSTPTLDVNKRAKNVIEIEVSDTTLSNLSLAVTDEAIATKPYEDNILSRLLLTGDIKGYVHEPAYYFSDTTTRKKQLLDLVMLTHGWRRYNWNAITSGRLPKLKYPVEQPLSIQAKVYGVMPGQIRNDEQLTLILETPDSAKHVLEMNKSGQDIFSIKNLWFFDTAKVFYQFNKERKLERTATVSFENNFYKGPSRINLLSTPWLLAPVDLSGADRTANLAQQLSKFGSSWNPKGNVLETVTVRTVSKTRIQEMEERYTSGMFKNADGFAFDLTDPNISPAFNIFQFLQGRVPGLSISNISMTGEGIDVMWRGSPTALFLNEMPVDASAIAGISVLDVAYVKVIRPPFLGSMGGGPGGAIAIYLKRGNDSKPIPGQSLSRTKVAGYAPFKEYYSPNYASRSASSDVVADYRTTLLWQPFILTDTNNRKVNLTFYNNDISTAFRIVLEGFNEIGQLVRIEKVVRP